MYGVASHMTGETLIHRDADSPDHAPNINTLIVPASAQTLGKLTVFLSWERLRGTDKSNPDFGRQARAGKLRSYPPIAAALGKPPMQSYCHRDDAYRS
jgi:hypothetical protein